MYYCALSLGVLEHTPQISCHFLKLSPPLQKFFKSPEQTQHHGNNPNPSQKNPMATLPKASPPLKKI